MRKTSAQFILIFEININIGRNYCQFFKDCAWSVQLHSDFVWIKVKFIAVGPGI